MSEKNKTVEWTPNMVSGFVMALAGAKALRSNGASGVASIGDLPIADFISETKKIAIELFTNEKLTVRFQLDGQHDVMECSIVDLERVALLHKQYCSSTGTNEPLKVWPSCFPSFLAYLEVENEILNSVVSN